MSIVSALMDEKTLNFEQAFNVKDTTTPAMKSAIRHWYDLYYDRNPAPEEDTAQRLPVTIISKLTKTTFSEYAAVPAKNAVKANLISDVISGLDLRRKQAIQQALIGGECYLKPIFYNGSILFNVIPRTNYIVLGRNERGEITDIGMQETTAVNKFYYTLLERRTVDANGYLTIISRLYRSNNRDAIGKEVPLSALKKYNRLRPVNRFNAPVNSIGLIPLKTPLANCVDGSEDGVCVYAPAVGLIHSINRNEAQINGEFERGESRIIVSDDLMEKDEGGKRKRLTENVFTSVDEDPARVGITIFSPALREQSFLARKTEYLRNIENIIGLKRGILSEVEAAERTATEVTSSAGDYNLTIIDFQQMWESAVREAVRVCDVLGQIYGYYDSSPVDPESDISVDWGNGILYDEEKEWANYMSLVASKMLKPEIALAWKFNIPWEKPEDLDKIREKYMPDLEHLMNEDDDE